jgi:nicotinate-nucleotide pyrophosphorylase (carboxylating)
LSPTSDVNRIAAVALAEDGETDLTSDLTVPPKIRAEASLEYRNGGVLAGRAYADAVAQACRCMVEWAATEGAETGAGSVIGTMRGELRHLLRAERPMLNILQRASGIATLTRAFVSAVKGTPCRILHTRKTAPGLRGLDVSAVIAGGGHAHRLDLSHELMVKDNHWQALAYRGTSLGRVLGEARRRGVTALYVEVESVDQLEMACAAGASRLLVDNQSPEVLRTWAVTARQQSPGIEIEASGGVTLENVRTYADAGADFVSIGALTHSARAADISLEVNFERISRR